VSSRQRSQAAKFRTLIKYIRAMIDGDYSLKGSDCSHNQAFQENAWQREQFSRNTFPTIKIEAKGEIMYSRKNNATTNGMPWCLPVMIMGFYSYGKLIPAKKMCWIGKQKFFLQNSTRYSS